MALLVTGATQALATAALAALTSGERVLVAAEGHAGPLPTHALRDGASTPIDLAPYDASTDRPTSVIVVSESRDLPERIRSLGSAAAGLPVLLAPGGFAGALRVHDLAPSLRAAECTGFPVSGRVEGSTIALTSIKRHLPLAAAQEEDTDELVQLWRSVLPTVEAASLATTSLSNTNHLIHPPLALLNAVRIDASEPFTFYRAGISPAADHLLLAIDEERRALCTAVGADSRSGRDWMVGFYGDSGMHGNTLVECLASYPHFETVPGPSTLAYRYLTDDVPHGIAQWAALGRRIGMETPHLDRLLDQLATIAPHLDLGHDTRALDLFLEHVAPRRAERELTV